MANKSLTVLQKQGGGKAEILKARPLGTIAKQNNSEMELKYVKNYKALTSTFWVVK